MELLLWFAIVLLIAIMISAFAKRTIVSTTALFLIAGVVLGDGFLGFLELDPSGGMVTTVSEIALFTVLFTDGQQLGIRELRGAWRLPGRALVLGLPLTLVITALLAVWVVGLSWPEALLVAAVLAPTDPVFASAIVGQKDIPYRTRNLLSVESGLNDGLALPLVLVFLAVVGDEAVQGGELLIELALGVVIGVAIPAAVRVLFLLPFVRATPLYATLTPVAVGLLVFAAAQLTSANLYLAAFSAGITIASVAPQTRDAFRELGEFVAKPVKLLAILIFGALVAPTLLADVSLGGYVFAALILLFARPIAVLIALLRSELPRSERFTVAWFGPKGFASVLYGLLVLNSGAANAAGMFHLIVVAVALSILAHSSTDVPIAQAFARMTERRAAPASSSTGTGDADP